MCILNFATYTKPKTICPEVEVIEKKKKKKNTYLKE